jgi:hypothetical protein
MSQFAKATFIPTSVSVWIEAVPDAASVPELRSALAPEVVFEFAGRKRHGADAVLEHFTSAPRAALASARHEVLKGAGNTWIVRFTGRDGATLPSPGGPMSAMDFLLTLDDDGLIAKLGMQPHHTEPADLAQPLGPGSKLPLFSLPDAHGTMIDWHDPQAAAHVVIWTCNACPWALGWHDRIQDVAREYAAREVRTVQINANDPGVSPADTLARCLQRVAAGDFAGPYLRDDEQRVARVVGARHTPEVFVTGPDRVIAYHGAPDADSEDPGLRASWLRAALDAVLDGRAPELAETEPIGCTVKWTP